MVTLSQPRGETASTNVHITAISGSAIADRRSKWSSGMIATAIKSAITEAVRTAIEPSNVLVPLQEFPSEDSGLSDEEMA